MKNSTLHILALAVSMTFAAPVWAQNHDHGHDHDHSSHAHDNHVDHQNHDAHENHASHQDHNPTEKENLSKNQSATSWVLNVNGLVCGFCAQGIEKSVKKMGGKDVSVDVDLEAGLVSVQNWPLELAALEKALVDAGYTVTNAKNP